MWQCVKCDQDVEENFFVCWNCGTARDGTEDPDFGMDADPPSDMRGAVVVAESMGDELAGRLTRLASAIVDLILLMGLQLPVYFATGFFERARTRQLGLLEQIAMVLLAIVVMLALNGYLLVTRGQTIGKVLTKTQIVDFESGRLLPFLRVYVYRYLWMLPLGIVVPLIPGDIDDDLVNFIGLIDALMIFGAGRRCLHDLIAGSKVVVYKAGRQKLV